MTVFIQDTFSGILNSTLSPAWVKGTTDNYVSGGGGNTPASATMDGAGRLRINLAGNGGYYNMEAVSTTPPPSANYYTEVDFSTVDLQSSNGNRVELLLMTNGAFPNYSAVTLHPKQSLGGGRSLIYISDRAAGVFSSNVFGPIYAGVNTLRAEVEGTTIRAYINGELKITLVGTTDVLGRCGFAFETDGPTVSDGTVLYEFRAGLLGP